MTYKYFSLTLNIFYASFYTSNTEEIQDPSTNGQFSESIDSSSTDSETITTIQNLTNECLDSVIEERLKSKLMISEVMARTGDKEEWDIDLGSLDYDMSSITSGHSSKHSNEMDVTEGVTPASSMETLADPVGNVMYIVVPGATRSSVESNSPLAYQRPAVIKRFLGACQRLRGVFKECLSVRAPPAACTEEKDQTPMNTDGNDYSSLVSMVLIRLMRKIEPTTEDTTDFTMYHGDLTEGIVLEFCSASGLLRNEVYPRSIKIEKICKKLYKELLKNFISKDMVHKLLLYRIPVFSTILTKCLVNELLRSVQGDAERDSGCKLFKFLQRFKLCGKVWMALKRKRANNVEAFFTDITKIEPSCCENGAQTCWVLPEEPATASS